MTVGTSGPAARLRSHGLRPPTVDDLQHALWTGTDDVVSRTWAAACTAAGLADDLVSPTTGELERIAAALTAMGGPVGLVGRAIGVRLAAYREIGARGADGPAPAWDWARVAMDTLLRGRPPRPERIAEIVALDPFAPELRVELDQAAARVAHRLGTQAGGISVVLDGGALCLAGRYGAGGTWMAAAGGCPVEWSFCATSVRTREPYVVPDVREDVLHRLNPTAVHDGIRSYAGAPLLTARGEVLGSCCVMDIEPRDFTAADVAALEEEAAAVVAELERRRAR